MDVQLQTESRFRSSILHAIVFAFLSGVLWVVADAIEPYGRLVTAAMWFSSPITYVVVLVLPHSWSRDFPFSYAFECVAPYLMYGAFVGYRWSLTDIGTPPIIRALLLRYCFVLCLIAGLGVLAGIWVGANDS